MLNWDGFARGLQGLIGGKGKGRTFGMGLGYGQVNGAGKAGGGSGGGGGSGVGMAEQEGWVLFVTHAERLKSVLGHQWAVMTRITELVSASASDVFVGIRSSHSESWASESWAKVSS